MKIIIALDTCHSDHVLSLVKILSPRKENIWFKIGLELFYSCGEAIVHQIHEQGFSIFLDLKIHDIPTTAYKAVKALSHLPVDMINVHALGGSEMMKRASEALQYFSKKSPLLLAVTQLTSTSMMQMNVEQNISGDLVDSVVHLSSLAYESGCQGVICSPWEVKKIKDKMGKNFLTVTPGIRLDHENKHDQKRSMSPRDAFLEGADYIVIGRPITQAQAPLTALDQIIHGNIL